MKWVLWDSLGKKNNQVKVINLVKSKDPGRVSFSQTDLINEIRREKMSESLLIQTSFIHSFIHFFFFLFFKLGLGMCHGMQRTEDNCQDLVLLPPSKLWG